MYIIPIELEGNLRMFLRVQRRAGIVSSIYVKIANRYSFEVCYRVILYIGYFLQKKI